MNNAQRENKLPPIVIRVCEAYAEPFARVCASCDLYKSKVDFGVMSKAEAFDCIMADLKRFHEIIQD